MQNSSLRNLAITGAGGLVFFGAMVGVVLAAPTPPKTSATAGQLETVTPFLQQNCVRCHGAQKQKAKFRVDNLGAVEGDAARAWAKVLEKLALREMPPPDEPQPKVEAMQRTVEWITAELSRNDRALMGQGAQPLLATLPRLDKPADGNRVPHEVLFNPKPGTRPDAPPRVWLRSPELYTGLVIDVGAKNAVGIAQPFTPAPGDGFKDYAALSALDEPTVAQLIRNAQQMVAHLTRHRIENGKVIGEGYPPREFLALLDPQNPPAETQIRAAIREIFHRAFRRAPQEEETVRFMALHAKASKSAGHVEAARSMLTAVLLRAETLFRSEIGEAPDGAGLARLTPREIAFAVAYALGDNRPDDKLLDAAAKGGLATREGVQSEVRRLLDEPKFNKPRLLRFFQQYFGYTTAPDVFKDNKEFKSHRADQLVRDTDYLVEWVLAQDKDVLRTLLTTDKSFVNFRTDPWNKKPPKPGVENEKVQLSYNLPADWPWVAEQPVTLPGSERAGVLTQPSWLVAHSSNFDNHAIRRGKWIRERLLGGYIPDLPITVDAQLSDDRAQTLRTRMEKTRAEYCWNCHSKMNPLGLAFENYDHFGRFRTQEINQPVDSSGVIEGSRDSDGTVRDSIEMIRRLAQSPRVQQVWVRHAFRYFMGRNETPGDGPTLVAMNEAYEKSGGSFKALLVELLASDSFLYRKAVP